MPDALTSAGATLRHSPLRFVISAWPFRALLYVITGAIWGLVLLMVLGTIVLIGVITLPLIVGFFMLREVPPLMSATAEFERARLRLVDTGSMTRLVRIRKHESVSAREYLAMLRSWGLRWRELVYVMLLAAAWIVDFMVLTIGPGLGVAMLISPFVVADSAPVTFGFWSASTTGEAWIVAGIGVVWLAAFVFYLVPLYAVGRAAVARALLAPDDETLRSEVARLRASRLDLVTAFATERRRIEGQLHDGVQHRLVALTMTLGLAEVKAGPGPVRELIVRAHQEADLALADLREAVRGISPQVLSDHGLEPAIRELAGRTPLPVSVQLNSGAGRLHPAVEDCSYFVVAESMSNALKHSAATAISVTGSVSGDRWLLQVTDNGGGGADPAGGHGIAGLAIRCTAIGGTLDVNSPEGGPTEVRMLCPLNPS